MLPDEPEPLPKSTVHGPRGETPWACRAPSQERRGEASSDGPLREILHQTYPGSRRISSDRILRAVSWKSIHGQLPSSRMLSKRLVRVT